MTITCKLGIELYNAHQNDGNPMQVLCRLKGVDRPEKLSHSELKDAIKISDTFNLATLTPKDASKVKLEFMLGEYYVSLDKFSELDITLQSLNMLEDFNPDGLDRMPVMLGCIYAPLIKSMFNLYAPVAKIAADTADAILEQVPFEDVFSLFDFFVAWKESSTRVPSLSIKHSMSSYRLRRRMQGPTRLLIKRSLTVLPTTLKPIVRVIRDSIFIVNISHAILTRWFWLIIVSLRKWWQRKRTR